MNIYLSGMAFEHHTGTNKVAVRSFAVGDILQSYGVT
jgi:hypothetical protein